MPTAVGMRDYLALRVINNFTGAEIVHELTHSACTWQVRALQAGMPGSSTLGQFTITSPAGPTSDEFRKSWQAQWRQLDLTAGQLRVEGYLGGRIAGTPRFSGVVTGGARVLDAPWTLTGVDSLWMLQQAQTSPGELLALPGNPAFAVAYRFCGGYETVWDDDFSGWNGSSHPNSSDYTASGFAFNASDPVFGLPNLRQTTGGNFVTNTTWSNNAQYYASYVTITGTVVATTGAGTVNNAEAAIWMLADTAFQNGIIVQLILNQTAASSGLYNAQVFIQSVSGGALTPIVASATNVLFAPVGATFPFQLTAYRSLTSANPGFETYRAFLNGQDCNIAAVNPASPLTGGVGVRSTVGTAAYINRIQFRGRTSGVPPTTTHFDANRFNLNIINTSSGVNFTEGLNAMGQTFLDAVVLAMTFDGFSVRKNPGVGHKADTLDYGGTGTAPSPGTDYSSTIVLEEGVNIVAQGTEVTTVAELLSNDVRVNSLPGGSSGGSIVWSRIGQTNDPVITDTVSDVGIPGFTLLVRNAQQIQGRKVNPLQAKQVHIVRDAAWLSVNNGAGPRELDAVGLSIPSLGVALQSAVIVGYDFVEGAVDMIVYLSQLPNRSAALHPMQRILRQLDNLGTTYVAR